MSKRINEDRSNLLIDKYLITKKLGSGSFGEVYMAENKRYGDVALKIEDRGTNSRIKNEFKIYKELYKVDNKSVRVYELVVTPDYNIMSMELLGCSLDKLFADNNNKFPPGFVLFIGYRMIELIEIVHGIGYLHRDIKPSNFLVRPGENDICAIDFGLSRPYMDDMHNHISMRTGRSLVGTARYASTNIHMGLEPSRRDDIESIGYVLLYFIRGRLPWQGLKRGSKKKSIKCIGDCKLSTSLDELCDGYPKSLRKIIEHARSLEFEERPDYDLLKEYIASDMMANK